MSTALAPVDRSTLAEVRRQIAELLHEDAEPSAAAEAYMRVLSVERQAKEIRALFEEQMLPWLALHENELTVGDTKLYAGVGKSEKVRDLKAACVSALDALGGDWDAFVELLSSNALKPGAAEAVLGEEWRREHFEVKRKEKVEVRTINTRYLPKESASEHVQAGRQE